MGLNRQTWETATNPALMLEAAASRVTGRKLRLFACANYRRLNLGTEVAVENLAAVDAAERFADGLATAAELHAARVKADDAARQTGGDVPIAVARISLSPGWSEIGPEFRYADQKRQVSLIRHIFGNPLCPYPEFCDWPTTVVQLAEAIYNGTDAGFALHDALLEAGHPELAEHFRKRTWHPKGCWVVDLLLGKT